MGSETIVDVGFKVSGYVYFMRIGEELGLTVRPDLGKVSISLRAVKSRSEAETYKAAEDFVTCFYRDRSTAVVNSHGSRRLPVGSKRAVKANTLHGIMEDLAVSFWRVRLGKAIDFRKVSFAFV